MDYLKKFKTVKKHAQNKGVSFPLAIFNAIGLSFMISWKFSYYSWIGLSNFELTQPISNLIGYLPYIYMAIIVITILDKITLGLIHVTHLGQKLVFHAIQRFDMWYYMKYKKQGPLTQGIWKFQQNLLRIDHRRKRQIIVTTLFIYAVYLCLKWEGFN